MNSYLKIKEDYTTENLHIHTETDDNSKYYILFSHICNIFILTLHVYIHNQSHYNISDDKLITYSI